jgi:sarcosine/dimethylglycine N-methyltransferase
MSTPVRDARLASRHATEPTCDEILERNHREYDDAADLYWRLTVFDAVHEGWWFSNIGGRDALEWIARHTGIGAGSRVLELCSGLGDTCRYLAERYGCDVTGVEMNAAQIGRARMRRELAGPARDRLRFVDADIATWKPAERYDVAYALDALMYVPARARTIATTYEALRDGGRLAFADVMAGPRITDEIRRRIWDEDGMIDLPDTEGQIAMLRDAAFCHVEVHDITPIADRRFRGIVEAAERHRRALVECKGRDRYQRWLTNARFYRRCFRGRALSYVILAARRP